MITTSIIVSAIVFGMLGFFVGSLCAAKGSDEPPVDARYGSSCRGRGRARGLSRGLSGHCDQNRRGHEVDPDD